LSFLSISEHFSSIQGEGKNAGKRSVFLRLTGCNLTCGGQATVKTGKLDSGATWRCDTIEVWQKGEKYEKEELLNLFKEHGYISELSAGAHLIITGGEPLLQESALVDFLELLSLTIPARKIFIEVETNGTITPTLKLSERVSQFNISPKLANSGMEESQRINNEALCWFVENSKSLFKFVVTRLEDWSEIEECFVKIFNIPKERIWLMPGADTRESLSDLQPIVAELCAINLVNFSPRLHIAIWDRKTGI